MTKSLPFLRTAYNYDMSQASDLSGLVCNDPSLAQQNSKDECDINVIMERFGRGMALPDNFRAPQYGDFTGIADYQSALNQVIEAQASFTSMPAKIRARFNNDPSQLMSFLDDPENRAEAQKLGLLVPSPAPSPKNATTEVVDPSTPPS